MITNYSTLTYTPESSKDTLYLNYDAVENFTPTGQAVFAIPLTQENLKQQQPITHIEVHDRKNGCCYIIDIQSALQYRQISSLQNGHLVIPIGRFIKSSLGVL